MTLKLKKKVKVLCDLDVINYKYKWLNVKRIRDQMGSDFPTVSRFFLSFRRVTDVSTSYAL